MTDTLPLHRARLPRRPHPADLARVRLALAADLRDKIAGTIHRRICEHSREECIENLGRCEMATDAAMPMISGALDEGSALARLLADAKPRQPMSAAERDGVGVRVTVQEAGVLQSFAADYPWQGTRTKQYEAVGNAIPPRVAAHVLAAVMGGPHDYIARINSYYEEGA